VQGALVDLGHDCSEMQRAMKVGRINTIVATTLFLNDRGNDISDLMRRLEQMSASPASPPARRNISRC
jgi:hypothetical protein